MEKTINFYQVNNREVDLRSSLTVTNTQLPPGEFPILFPLLQRNNHYPISVAWKKE